MTNEKPRRAFHQSHFGGCLLAVTAHLRTRKGDMALRANEFTIYGGLGYRDTGEGGGTGSLHARQRGTTEVRQAAGPVNLGNLNAEGVCDKPSHLDMRLALATFFDGVHCVSG